MVTIKCANCRSEFKVKLGRSKQPNCCCSRSCATSLQNRNRSVAVGNGKGDSLTKFRWFYHHARVRLYQRTKRSIPVTITIENIRDQWHKQKGKCPYTGWDLILPKNGSGWSGNTSMKRASLDRKNSSRGYEPDNIQFVSIVANWAKNSLDSGSLVEFCHAVSRFQIGGRDGTCTHNPPADNGAL